MDSGGGSSGSSTQRPFSYGAYGSNPVQRVISSLVLVFYGNQPPLYGTPGRFTLNNPEVAHEGGSDPSSNLSHQRIEVLPRPWPNSGFLTQRQACSLRYRPPRHAVHLPPETNFFPCINIDTSQNMGISSRFISININNMASFLGHMGEDMISTSSISSLEISDIDESYADSTWHELIAEIVEAELAKLTLSNSDLEDVKKYLDSDYLSSIVEDNVKSCLSKLMPTESAIYPLIDQAFEFAELRSSNSDDVPSVDMEDVKKYLNYDDFSSIIEENIKSCLSELMPFIEEHIESAIHPLIHQGFENLEIENLLEQMVVKKLEDSLEKVVQSSCKRIPELLQEFSFRKFFDPLMIEFASALDRMCSEMGSNLEEHVTMLIHESRNQHLPIAPDLADVEELMKSFQVRLAKLGDVLREVLIQMEQKLRAFVDGTIQMEASCNPNITGTLESLRKLMKDKKYQEAFSVALHEGSAPVLHWLCDEFDLDSLFSWAHLPVSQETVLSLLRWLSSDLATGTTQKLSWMVTVAGVIDPMDDSISSCLVKDIDVVLRTLFVSVPVVCAHRKNRRALIHMLQNLRRICTAHEIAKRYNE